MTRKNRVRKDIIEIAIKDIEENRELFEEMAKM